jgi:hypothetical protein
MKRYAIFLAATGPCVANGKNYLPDTNCLLNSIQKQQLHTYPGCELDVYLLHHGFDPAWKYPETAVAAFDYHLIPIELKRSEIPHPAATKCIEFVKRARYFKLLELAPHYDAVCLLDADMFFVSRAFMGLFDLVYGTDKLIGCNEKIKWDMGPTYMLGNEPIFSKPTRLHSMICNVPSVFDMKRWWEVFEFYTKICFDGRQDLPDGTTKGIGDLFAHNISIQHAGRADDVIMLPLETLAQVHHVWRRPWTYLINDGGKWRSQAGDRVYMIHDTKRIARPSFVTDNLADFDKDEAGWQGIPKVRPKVEAGLRACQKEWYDLNFNSRVRLDAFLEHNPDWDALKGT